MGTCPDRSTYQWHIICNAILQISVDLLCWGKQANPHTSPKKTFSSEKNSWVVLTSTNLEEANLLMMMALHSNFRKSDNRDQRVHMFQTTDPLLNPAKAWTQTAQHMWKISGATHLESKVCNFQPPWWNHQQYKLRTSMRHLCSIVTIIAGEN